MKASIEAMPLSSGRPDKGLITSHFRNEIGNPIHIRVEETQDTGTNAKTQKRSTFASSSAASTSSSTQNGLGLLWKMLMRSATAVIVFSPPDMA